MRMIVHFGLVCILAWTDLRERQSEDQWSIGGLVSIARCSSFFVLMRRVSENPNSTLPPDVPAGHGAQKTAEQRQSPALIWPKPRPMGLI